MTYSQFISETNISRRGREIVRTSETDPNKVKKLVTAAITKVGERNSYDKIMITLKAESEKVIDAVMKLYDREDGYEVSKNGNKELRITRFLDNDDDISDSSLTSTFLRTMKSMHGL